MFSLVRFRTLNNMLHIKIVLPSVREVVYPKHLRNNPQWLRKLDKEGKTIYLNPYREKDWFRLKLIEPLLDGGIIREDAYNVENVFDDIHYVVEKLTELETTLFITRNK